MKPWLQPRKQARFKLIQKFAFVDLSAKKDRDMKNENLPGMVENLFISGFQRE
jgi:hypothetical protein